MLGELAKPIKTPRIVSRNGIRIVAAIFKYASISVGGGGGCFNKFVNELSSSIKGGRFHDRLSSYELLMFCCLWSELFI
jgi:hypothetical protein